jgi:hypothetical protein
MKLERKYHAYLFPQNISEETTSALYDILHRLVPAFESCYLFLWRCYHDSRLVEYADPRYP